MGRGSKDKTVFISSVEICALGLLLRLKSGSARRGHPIIQILWTITWLLVTSVSLFYRADEFHFLFLLSLLLRPTQQWAVWCNLVCVECLYMIKQMEVDFCWALMILWAFGMDFEYTCTVWKKWMVTARWVYKSLRLSIIL